MSTTPAKSPTYVDGFDAISGGGLPRGRMTLVCGTAGSGKTVFAMQYLVEGIRRGGEAGVFVSFEESAADLVANMAGFGWDLGALVDQGRLVIVDATPPPDEDSVVAGDYELGALLARVRSAVEQCGASRVVLDSTSVLTSQFPDVRTYRAEMQRMRFALQQLGASAIITAERSDDYGPLTRSGVEEFVADNVVVLRNVLEDEKRRRTVEILKFRGTQHQRGEFPFTILSSTGLIVVPLSGEQRKRQSSDIRVTSGIPELDRMCDGGLFRDSVTLVSGATGTGKTLMVTHFVAGGASGGERVLLFAFEESREQLVRNARGWGVDIPALEEAGLLRVSCQYPEMTGPEEHLVRIKDAVDSFQPARIAIDSLSAIERVTTARTFREFTLGLASFLKERDVAALFTATTERLLGGPSITDSDISTVTDAIVLLRYLEVRGEVQRSIAVLKMRGSSHDKTIRRFSIDAAGIHIGDRLSDISGVLAGVPMELLLRGDGG